MMIIDMKIFNELEYAILGNEEEYGFLVKLRDAEGLDKDKVKRTFELLEQTYNIYKGCDQIDKKIIELIIDIPEQMGSFIEWNIEEKKEIENYMIEFKLIIRKILNS